MERARSGDYVLFSDYEELEERAKELEKVIREGEYPIATRNRA